MGGKGMPAFGGVTELKGFDGFVGETPFIEVGASHRFAFISIVQLIPEVPQAAWDIMDLSEKPVTIVYDNPRGVAPNLVAPDQTLAVRLTSHPFCRELLRRFRRPLVSTSANLSGAPTPQRFSEIDPAILNAVDYVVPLEQDNLKSTPSSIIQLKAGGQVRVIRP